MASLELNVMRSYTMACDVIKDAVISSIQNAALRSDVTLTKEDLAKIANIVRTSVDVAGRNSARQIQSALKSESK